MTATRDATAFFRLPPLLQPGDEIAIAATARPVEAESLRPFCQWLVDEGFRCRMAPNIGRQHHVFAGTVDERYQALQAMLDDPNLRAIWFARGGYGSIHLLPHLDWTAFKRSPKWLVGFSDACILLTQALNHGVSCLHAPMPYYYEAGAPEWAASLALLRGGREQWRQQQPALVADHPTAGLWGGNLSTLLSLVGTPWAYQGPPGLLLMEEVDEYLYHLDRQIFQLRWSHDSEISAIIAGQFTDMKDNESTAFGATPIELIRNWFGAEQPRAELSSGHGRPNYPLLFGA